MGRWEYRVVTTASVSAEMEEQFTRVGAEGWELVSVVPVYWSQNLVDEPVQHLRFSADTYQTVFRRRVLDLV